MFRKQENRSDDPKQLCWAALDDLAIERSAREGWTSFEAVLNSAAGGREQLGELLLQAQRITGQQRDFALAEQKKTGGKLGDLLVRLGWLTVAELDAVLALQGRQNGADGRLRLGNILMALGVISQEQLQDAVQRQQLSRKRLGEVLVDAGHAESGQVLRGLSLQRRLMKAALAALLSFAATAAAPMASAEGRTSSITVSATVLPSVKLSVLHQADRLTITAADIGRGYAHVPAASRIEVKTNSPDGFVLVFDAMPKLFKAVQIAGLGGRVELGAEGGAVVQRRRGRQAAPFELGYRFILSEGVQPGSYAWPIALSARPL